MILPPITNFAAAVSTSCGHGSFLSFPTWYEYLPGATTNGVCNPQISRLSDIWLIGAAIIEMLLRVAALAAVAYLIYGGFNYVTSQGEPDKTKQARSTILNALVGLIIAVLATGIVAFIAGSVK